MATKKAPAVASNGHAEPDILTRDDGYAIDVLFPLNYTKQGKHARVRRLPLLKLVTLFAPSPTMQSVVLEVFENVKDNPDTADPVGGGLLDQFKKNDALVNGTCVLGFVDPILTETEEEAEAANDPHVLWVERIHPQDRQAYFDLVNAPESEAAKALEPFPAQRVEGARPDGGLSAAPTPIGGAAAA